MLRELQLHTIVTLLSSTRLSRVQPRSSRVTCLSFSNSLLTPLQSGYRLASRRSLASCWSKLTHCLFSLWYFVASPRLSIITWFMWSSLSLGASHGYRTLTWTTGLSISSWRASARCWPCRLSWRWQWQRFHLFTHGHSRIACLSGFTCTLMLIYSASHIFALLSLFSLISLETGIQNKLDILRPSSLPCRRYRRLFGWFGWSESSLLMHFLLKSLYSNLKLISFRWNIPHSRLISDEMLTLNPSIISCLFFVYFSVTCLMFKDIRHMSGTKFP